MSQHIVITGAKPYDGRYELDLTHELTTREWGWIKRLSGYLPSTLTDDSFSDPEFGSVLAVIAMRRAGRIQPAEVVAVFERLADAPFGSTITIEGDPAEDEGEDVLPPPGKSSSSNGTSGAASPPSSATPASNPRPTGTRASVTSASAPAMSAS